MHFFFKGESCNAKIPTGFLLCSKCDLLQHSSEKQPLFACYLKFAEPAGQAEHGCLPGS